MGKLIKACRNLVVWDKDEDSVSLSHRSVGQFIHLASREDTFEALKFDPEKAQIELGHYCMVYILFEDFRVTVAMLQDKICIVDVPQPIKLATQYLPNALARLVSDSSGTKYMTLLMPKHETEMLQGCSKYKLLNYARSYWTVHTRHLPHSKTLVQEYDLLSSLVLGPNF